MPIELDTDETDVMNIGLPDTDGLSNSIWLAHPGNPNLVIRSYCFDELSQPIYMECSRDGGSRWQGVMPHRSGPYYVPGDTWARNYHALFSATPNGDEWHLVTEEVAMHLPPSLRDHQVVYAFNGQLYMQHSPRLDKRPVCPLSDIFNLLVRQASGDRLARYRALAGDI